MMHSARAVSHDVAGQHVAGLDLALDVARGGLDEEVQRAAVGGLDLQVVGRRVGERLHHGAVALEHATTAAVASRMTSRPEPSARYQMSATAALSAVRRSTTLSTRWWRSRK